MGKARATGSGLTPKEWAKKFMTYSLEQNRLQRMGLIGYDDKACIQIIRKEDKTKGETTQIQLTGPLTGVGGGDDANSADVMEAYDSYYDDITLHERVKSTGVNGPMTKQRLLENWDSEADTKLGDWKGRIMELEIIQALCNLYNLSTDVETVNEVALSEYRTVHGGEAADGTLGVKSCVGVSSDVYSLGTTGGAYTDALLSAETNTGYYCGPKLLEHVMAYWLDQEPRPRPLRIDGRDLYLWLITSGQALDLQHNTYYRNHFTYADIRGSQNTLMKNSLGVWNCGENSVLIIPYGRMPKRTGAGGTTPQEGFTLNTARTATSDAVASGAHVGRSLLLGCQAGVVCYGNIEGQMFKRSMGDLDNGTGRKPFKTIDWIYAVKQTQFKNEAGTAQAAFASMVIDTCQSMG